MLFSKKNVLALTASAAVLGGLSVSANAAQNSDTTDNQPSNVVGSYSSNQKKYFDANGNESTNQDNIQGKSDAHVKVTQGYLTLDLVPSFGFGTVNGNGANNSGTNSEGSRGGQFLNDIVDHDAILNNDSLYNTNTNKLSVTDSRESASNGGYTVSATMGNFKSESNGDLNGDALTTKDNPFVLTLKNGEIKRDKESDVKGQNSFSLTENSGSVNNVLKSEKDGTGNSSITFNNGSLYVPDGIKPGSYAASITWTLTPDTANSGTSQNQ